MKITNKKYEHEYWIHRDRDICWIGIPKNGYTVMKKLLTRERFTCTNSATVAKEMGDRFAVIRHPEYRLISGINEYANRNNDKRSIPALLEQLIQDPADFDEHVDPQLHFLSEVIPSHVVRYTHFTEDLHELGWFNGGNVNQYVNTKKAMSSKIGEINTVRHRCKDLIQQAVKKYYMGDCALWWQARDRTYEHVQFDLSLNRRDI